MNLSRSVAVMVYDPLSFITQRVVISQKRVLFTIAIGRQVYLFADIMCARRHRELRHQL